MDALSLKSEKEFKVRPCLKGCDCSLSGVQNQCEKMLREGAAGEDIAKYCLTFIGKTILGMCAEIKKKYSNLPIVFAGGVMSNTLIRKMIERKLGDEALFALPELSCDNAVGTAVLGEVLYGE